jgi:hypothetical protein
MTMTSPKNQAEALMNDLLPFAKQMLAEHGEFYPYGGFMRSDGSIVHVGAKHPATRHPPSVDLLDILKQGLRENADDEKMIAAAIVADVRVIPPDTGKKSEAIQVTVEHRDSYCADVFFPYRLDESHKPEFGKVFAQAGERSIFTHG